jgi:5-methylcytosine-specific restriction protein A
VPNRPKRLQLPGEKHRREERAIERRRYDNTPERAQDKAFYCSAAWRRLRAAHLTESPLCADCKNEGIIEPATQVDHVKDRKDHPELALDQSNLRSLCLSHHSRKTASTRRWGSKAGKEDGSG